MEAAGAPASAPPAAATGLPTGRLLFLRVLAEPNPKRGGVLEWRQVEVAARATELACKRVSRETTGTTLRQHMLRMGLVQTRALTDTITLWSLTPEARGRSHTLCSADAPH